MNTGLEMTTLDRTVDPMVEILLERSMSGENQPIDSRRAMIETLRSVQRANFIYTNTMLDLVAGRDDDAPRAA